MGQFAAALGHEINNPLACVHTNFTLLRETFVALSGAVREWQGGTPWAQLEERLRRDVLRVTIEGPDILDECEAALALMRQVSDDLRAVTRYRTDSVERFDLNEVVRTACRVARLEPRLGTKMRIELPGTPIRVHGSPGRMAQVVMNLVANAAEATDSKRPNRITVRSFATETHAVLEVADTGVGIASEHLDSIFEPFVTYRREQGGTGIGLGIVWQVVEEHGGRVEVESQVGIGSTFRALLPLPRPSPAPKRSSEARELPRGLRILLVEDNALVRQSMVRAFPEQHVTAVANGQEAVDAIERQSPDVVVTDLAMPELDGIELYRRIVERWPFLANRILFVSGTDSLIERARAALPSLPLLRKPFPVRDLHMMLLEVYESNAAGRPSQ
jgi:CheY-like chemotaxis protein